MEMALIVDIITHLIGNSLRDTSNIQTLVNNNDLNALVGVVKELLDDDYNYYNNTLLAIQSNELDKIKVNIDSAKSLYFEGLDNPDITKQKLDSAHDKLRDSLLGLTRYVERYVAQLRNCHARFNKGSIFGQRNLNAEIDKNILFLTKAMRLFTYTVELDYAVNSVLQYNVERSFSNPCRDMVKFIEDEKVHRLVLSLCGDNDDVYDFWYHMDNDLRSYLEPPLKVKQIGLKK
jgi:hypothetical protein